MKKLGLGVVGTGEIGKYHMKKIKNNIPYADIVAVTARRKKNAVKANKELELNAVVHDNDTGVINDKNVDAILVTTPTPAHKDTILKAIEAEKYVFVEKPLAATAEEGKEIIKAEQIKGKKFVNVGFMRRYDNGYKQMKEAISKNNIGEPLIVYCKHRDASEGESYTSKMAITESLIHEIDTVRWMVGEEYEAAKVSFPRKTSNAYDHVHDPQLITLTTKAGVVVIVEVFANAQYGYDIQCEVVGENGVLSLPEVPTLEYRQDKTRGKTLYSTYKERFSQAFDSELKAFVKSIITTGELQGPTAWDGYVASLIADACIKSQETGNEVFIEQPETPEFYK